MGFQSPHNVAANSQPIHRKKLLYGWSIYALYAMLFTELCKCVGYDMDLEVGWRVQESDFNVQQSVLLRTVRSVPLFIVHRNFDECSSPSPSNLIFY